MILTNVKLQSSNYIYIYIYIYIYTHTDPLGSGRECLGIRGTHLGITGLDLTVATYSVYWLTE